MSEKPIQDYYPDEVAVCYGCGRKNPDGLHVQTHWQGNEGVCHFTPKTYHPAFRPLEAREQPILRLHQDSSAACQGLHRLLSFVSLRAALPPASCYDFTSPCAGFP